MKILNDYTMELGVILYFSPDEKIGKLLTIGKLDKQGDEKYETKFCFFKLEESSTVLYRYKVVAIESLQLIDQESININIPPFWDEKFEFWALGINDRINDIQAANIFFPTNYQLNYLKFEIPYCNPSLFNFFFINNLIEISGEWNHYLGARPGEAIKKIKSLRSLLNEIENFSIEKAIESYSISIESYASSNPGKDDSASITMVGTRTYWPTDSKYDPFIDQYLDNFHKPIAYDKGWAPANSLLWELWEQIGGEEKKIELEQDCISIREEKIEHLIQAYSIEKHMNYVRREAYREERELKCLIENAYKRIKIY